MAKIKSRKAAATCLTCSNKAQSRGLCWRCHAAFTAVRDRLPEEKRAAFEARLIKRDLLLPMQRYRSGRRAKSGFAKALAKANGAK